METSRQGRASQIHKPRQTSEQAGLKLGNSIDVSKQVPLPATLSQPVNDDEANLSLLVNNLRPYTSHKTSIGAARNCEQPLDSPKSNVPYQRNL
jgi:hypothetical protein